jgi:hypothetical protein
MICEHESSNHYFLNLVNRLVTAVCDICMYTEVHCGATYVRVVAHCQNLVSDKALH